MIPATTIAAISTPPGKGGVALLRVSGGDAFEVVARVFRPYGGKNVAELAPRRAVWGDILYEGEEIDDGVLTLFPAPNSYTGEDVAEITCHGGVLVTQRVLESLLLAGALPAGPGEFTRRALTAGKITLDRAEAVGGLLEAKSEEALKLYRRSSRDALSEKLGEIYEALLSAVSAVYAKIDYPDEDLADLSAEEILAEVDRAIEKADALLATYQTGKAITEGISTVLCGRANVGKSSLYNCLVGRSAAIVTDVAGTTRDVLESTVSCGRVLLRLCDTAGVRDTEDPVEKIGVARSREAIQAAELILAVFDGSEALTAEDFDLISRLSNVGGVKVALINKKDKGAAWDACALGNGFAAHLSVSAKENDMMALAGTVEKLFTNGELEAGSTAILSSARQFAALHRGREALRGAEEALLASAELDAAVSDMEVALAAFGECDGRSVSADVVDRIFSAFCVGK